jgi:hypothetical protein
MGRQDERKSIELKMHCQPLFWARAGALSFGWLPMLERQRWLAGKIATDVCLSQKRF